LDDIEITDDTAMTSAVTPAVPDGPLEETAYTVSELARRIRDVLEGSFPAMVWVRGEVANLSRSNAGHVYLDLLESVPPGSKGDPALLHAVIWESRRHAINQALRKANWGAVSEGDQIKARVWVDFYPPQGRITLRIHEVDPHYTLGKWKAERERVVALLKKEGLFERNKNVALPVAPRRIGLITSADTNAFADFTSTLSEGGLGWMVVFHHSGVQGEGARGSLVKALEHLCGLNLDVICMVRGGGSATDLAVFDHEEVVRAVANARVPVITGIGHELDQTVSDLVAHHSAKTPTACATFLEERVRRFGMAVNDLGREVAVTAAAVVGRHRRRLDGSPVEVSVSAAGALRRFRRRLQRSAQMLPAHVGPLLRRAGEMITSRQADLARDTRQVLERAQAGLDAAQQVSEAYDPQRNLARGWSITRRRQGGVIRTILHVGPGETIETWLSDGTVVSTVSGVRPDQETENTKEVRNP
jgi:exodeoxyribonuclease VII large subunit